MATSIKLDFDAIMRKVAAAKAVRISEASNESKFKAKETDKLLGDFSSSPVVALVEKDILAETEVERFEDEGGKNPEVPYPIRQIIPKFQDFWQDDGGRDHEVPFPSQDIYYPAVVYVQPDNKEEVKEMVGLTSMGELMDREEEILEAKRVEEKAVEVHHHTTIINIRNLHLVVNTVPREGEFLSAEQWAASEQIIAGRSICLVGKAGTGKTTVIKETVKRMQQQHRAVPMHDTDSHKYLKAGSLGVVCVAFTNRAINNISKAFDLGTTQINFMTIHKLLEYQRDDVVIEDKETGEFKVSKCFIPTRHQYRKLPEGIHTIIVEESSMVSYDDLWAKLYAATWRHVQFVFLGDLQQLPPIYGPGVLGYKLNELPVYELTKIYRQAAENPIISMAWDVSNGVKLTKSDLIAKYNVTSKDPEHPIKMSFFVKKIDWENAVIVMGKFFCNMIDKGVLDPHEDIILVPYNKQLGSIALNSTIAQHLSEKRGDQTYEIIAGFQKHYYAVGDKVIYNKKEGYITKINKNGKYAGRAAMPPSVDLHRDGTYHAKDSKGVAVLPEQLSSEEVDRYLMAIMDASDDDISNQASHIVHVKLLSEQMEDGSHETEVCTRGEFSNLDLAYAITIHKAQGSEWRKVFLLFHNSHHSINRELLYTAITRASRQLFIMCEDNTFVKGVERQRIPGDTLQDKINWFKVDIEERIKKAREKGAGKGQKKANPFDED